MNIPTYYDMDELQSKYQPMFKYCSLCGAVIAGNTTNHYLSKAAHDKWHMDQNTQAAAELLQAKFDIGILQQRILKLEQYEDTLLEMIETLEKISESV